MCSSDTIPRWERRGVKGHRLLGIWRVERRVGSEQCQIPLDNEMG